jgi:hypothetical protein
MMRACIPESTDKEVSPMKKAFILMLALILIALPMTGTAESAIRLRYAELAETDHPLTADARYFAQRVEELSGGRIRLAAGTLYGALNTLCDKGWIVLKTVDEDSRRKEYQLTDKGREILVNEVKRLKELVHNGEMILGEEL